MVAEFSQDGSKLAVTTFTGGWILADSISGRTLATAPPSTPYSMRWALTPDGTRLVGIQQDALLIAHVDSPADLEVLRSSNSPLLLVQEYERIYNDALAGKTPTAAEAAPATAAVGESAWPASAFTPDGRWLAARASDGIVDLWDLGTGSRLPFRLSSGQGLK